MSVRDSAGSGEDRLIADYFRPLADRPEALALDDDAAFFAPPAGCDLVVTTDAIVAGVHFFADDPADAIARKALRVNLSDLAAKGADPAGFLLAIALPAGTSDEWLGAFSQGLAADAKHYRCPLFGGDTVRSPGPLMISITAFGTLPSGAMVHRAGAGAGDRVLVSGTIGDAALGLKLRRDAGLAQTWRLASEPAKHLVGRYRLPQPRNALAAAVRMHASAAMDVSDGLVGDLGKLCRASGVSGEIDLSQVPLSPNVRALIAVEPDLIETLLTGGDDYEILCTVPESKVASFAAAASAAGIAVTDIGRVLAGSGAPRFIGPAGKPMEFSQGAFSHF
ncbi:MAG TPA: thiamine-phosphate kinase [Xanthobacteraceae bacterium]|nr:thiamine-phosphate kinase [Xanthobacteraceae bacterium]